MKFAGLLTIAIVMRPGLSKPDKERPLSEGCESWRFLDGGTKLAAWCWAGKPGKSILKCSKLDLNLCFGWDPKTGYLVAPGKDFSKHCDLCVTSPNAKDWGCMCDGPPGASRIYTPFGLDGVIKSPDGLMHCEGGDSVMTGKQDCGS